MLSVNNSYNQSEYFIPISKGLEKSSLENSLKKALEIGKIYLNKIGENYTFRFARSEKDDSRIAATSNLDGVIDEVITHVNNAIADLGKHIADSLALGIAKAIADIGKGKL